MTLNKPSGNMYSFAWTFSPWGGICYCDIAKETDEKTGKVVEKLIPTCDWCYVPNKFGWLKKYKGRPYFVYQGEFKREGKKLPALRKNDNRLDLSPQIAQLKPLPIFVQPMGDFMHPDITNRERQCVMRHCQKFDNPYLWLTKHPSKMQTHLRDLPRNSTVGTTIETNRGDLIQQFSRAPPPYTRAVGLHKLRWRHKMISIEPILECNPTALVGWARVIAPDFVAIGANSVSRIKTPNPKKATVIDLVNQLLPFTQVRLKKNLNTLGFHFEDDQVLLKGDVPWRA